MNERIVKLFMQSVDSNYIPLPIEDHMPSWTEKFAELIVREMAAVFDKRAEPGTGFYEPHEPAELIRKHFGVEE